MDAFREELTSLLPRLRAFARSLARNADVADDLVQDTVVIALQAEERFTPGTNLSAWLFTILRNRFRRVAAGSGRTMQLPEQSDLDRIHSVAARQEQAVEIRDFRNAFAGLGAAHREVLVLVGVHGLSYDEAAEQCACEVGTVKSRLSRARAQLSALMGSSQPHARRPTSSEAGARRTEPVSADKGHGSRKLSRGHAVARGQAVQSTLRQLPERETQADRGVNSRSVPRALDDH